jgi:integrase
MARKLPEGVTIRHARNCATAKGKRCSCTPRYQAQVWSPRDHRRISRTFPDPTAAKGWRIDSLAAIRSGTMRAGGGTTLRAAAEEWMELARSGVARNRSGDTYKPSTLRGYERELRDRILPDLGAWRLSDIRRGDIQRLVERLQAKGLDASTIRNVIMPLRVVFRRAVALEDVAVNPTVGLELPAVRGRRDRIAAPADVTQLLGALPTLERAVYASAFYAGLRLGELRALELECIDLDTHEIRVEANWDPVEGRVEPKSRAGTRTVPIPKTLRPILAEHIMGLGRREGLAFGRDPETPFSHTGLPDRCARLWKAENKRRTEADGEDAELLEPIGLHDARHTYASLMIAAGVNLKALSEFMGHASVTITLDRYGHLLPGSREHAAGLLDTFLGEAGTG